MSKSYSNRQAERRMRAYWLDRNDEIEGIDTTPIDLRVKELLREPTLSEREVVEIPH